MGASPARHRPAIRSGGSAALAAPATSKAGMLSAHPGLFLSYPAAAQCRRTSLSGEGPGAGSLRPRAALLGSLTPGPFPNRQEKTRSATGLRVFGAGDRDRTGTMFPSADFKSAASANFATPTDFSAFSLPQPAGKCKGGAKKSGGAGQYDTVAGRCAIPAQEPPAAAYNEACLRAALGCCAPPAPA